MLRFVSRLFTRSKPFTYRCLSTNIKPEELVSNRKLFFHFSTLAMHLLFCTYFQTTGDETKKLLVEKGCLRNNNKRIQSIMRDDLIEYLDKVLAQPRTIQAKCNCDIFRGVKQWSGRQGVDFLCVIPQIDVVSIVDSVPVNDCASPGRHRHRHNRRRFHNCRRYVDLPKRAFDQGVL